MKIVQLTYNTLRQAMGYVIQSATGQVCVVDGGCHGDEKELKRVIDKFGGHVDLWLMTHPHADHYGAVIDLLSQEDTVTYDRFGTSQLPRDWVDPDDERNAHDLYEWLDFADTLDERHFKLEVGQRFELGSLSIEVLTGPNPEIPDDFNEQSCVLRFVENGFVMVFLGDLGVSGGHKLLKTYPGIRCDAVQMAHHGQGGVDEDVYRQLSPKYALWPTTVWIWNNTNLEGRPHCFETPHVRRWMSEIGTENILSFEHSVLFDTETCKYEPF